MRESSVRAAARIRMLLLTTRMTTRILSAAGWMVLDKDDPSHVIQRSTGALVSQLFLLCWAHSVSLSAVAPCISPDHRSLLSLPVPFRAPLVNSIDECGGASAHLMEPTSEFESLCDAKGTQPGPDCKYSVRQSCSSVIGTSAAY